MAKQLLIQVINFIKKYKWTLKLKISNRIGFYFGIASDKLCKDSDFTMPLNDSVYYAFGASNCMMSRDVYELDFYSSPQGIQNESIVCIILDVDTQTFQCIVDGVQDPLFRLNNVKMFDVKYNLAVTIYNKGQEIQLLKYETEKYH